MKNLNSAKELKAMAIHIPESLDELKALETDLRSQIRTKMIEELVTGTRVVTFSKVNGDERVMTCTLDNSLIPQDNQKSVAKSPKPVNEEVLPVWDVKAQGWRSFRIDNVISFE